MKTPTPLYIFDLDGTLCDAQHRRHLVENPGCDVCGWRIEVDSSPAPPCSHCKDKGRNPGWEPDFATFNASCGKDAPIASVLQTLHILWWYGCDIWFFTGRPDSVREQTEDWIMEHVGLHESMVREGQVNMRVHGDWRADHIIKQEMLDRMLPEDRDRLVAVYDDRQRVVDMWRANGITCFQCAPGKF